MTDRLLKTALGGMLHDVGKVLYRDADGRNHSQSGYDFLKDEIGISDREILDQVRYHHWNQLKGAVLPANSLAYITYIADNIAAAADRRENDSDDTGFDKTAALESVFNILNGNHQTFTYQPGMVGQEKGINYPSPNKAAFSPEFYKSVRFQITDALKGIKNAESISVEYVNSLLSVLEATLSFVPSSTSRSELVDISLYDHMKLTAAIGNCILAFLEERQEEDYKTLLVMKNKEFYGEKAFLLLNLDISGIQAFIYHQYGTEDVLKNLRARSFYLEIIMENMIDELLSDCGLSRANLIYSGGGHAYMLLPNTAQVKKQLQEFLKTTNSWFMDKFGTELFLAAGYAEGSADDLCNKPEGSYQELFRKASKNVSAMKNNRYSAKDIILLNKKPLQDGTRECKICHRSDLLGDDNLCEICAGLIALAKEVLQKQFFSVVLDDGNGEGIPVWKHQRLIGDTEESLRHRMKSDLYIRSYSKNQMYTGVGLSTNLWVGDYAKQQTIEALVNSGTGIKRMGVLRADVDNLGQAFVAGFPPKYQTFSRSAAFSRKLSQFFKLHINDILENGECSLDGNSGPRNAAIIYSGGDDVFVIGAWKDILEFSVDLYRRFKRFTQGTLTFSGGFGLYQPKYPIAYVAEDAGRLEDRSKSETDKNSVTLFELSYPEDESEHHGYQTTWSWPELIEGVIGEKFNLIYEYLTITSEKGKKFLYNLLELFRTREEKINLARLAYYLARMEPDSEAPALEKELYQKFSRCMYQWKKNDHDSDQVILAIYLYSYMTRVQEA